MTPILRWRLVVSLVGFVIWGIGARADGDGTPWAKTAMTVGLVILAASVAMRFIKPRPPVERPADPRDEP